MIVRKLDELAPERVVSGETWMSRRLVLAGDRVGFSLHDTVIKAGTTTEMHYANHIEAVYLIQGKGHITVVETGERFDLAAGSMYLLDKHDRHVLVCDEEMRMVCVFNPPVVGPETHDEHGVYPLMTVEPPQAAAAGARA